MIVLCLNCGSSSLKFALRVVKGPSSSSESRASGIVERIGKSPTLSFEGPTRIDSQAVDVADHACALNAVLKLLREQKLLDNVDAVGHRVVHGGSKYDGPTLIDESVIQALTELEELAPLHNGPAVAAIQAAWDALGHRLPMVAVFDTGFYTDLPARASEYAIPRKLSRQYEIRRYGFHGIAHRSMLEAYQRKKGTAIGRVVSLQLGNGCSATASLNGKPIDTSMGFTPLEGLIMGTRSGDIDPSAALYLMHKASMTADQVSSMLNQESGLLGLSGISSDMRSVLEAEASGSKDAALAVESFCYRVVKYVGAYTAALGGQDALLFGGGIGERSAEIRRRICNQLGWLGLTFDDAANTEAGDLARKLSAPQSAIEVWKMAVDEEDIMARDVFAALESRSVRH